MTIPSVLASRSDQGIWADEMWAEYCKLLLGLTINYLLFLSSSWLEKNVRGLSPMRAPDWGHLPLTYVNDKLFC